MSDTLSDNHISVLTVSRSITVTVAGDGITEEAAIAAAEDVLVGEDGFWEVAEVRRIGRNRVAVRFVE